MVRVAYLRGRPEGYWLHNAYAQAIGAEFRYIDEAARWHDLALPAWRRYWRWAVNAWSFPWRQYDALLIEGPHIWPPLAAKAYHKVVWSLVDEQTLYFLYSGFFSRSSAWALRTALRSYRGLFVMGRMLARLAQEVLGPQTPPLYVGFNGVHTDRLEVLLRARPSLEQPVILLIAHGPDGWRSHYKGMDIFFDTLVRVKARLPRIRALVVGEWSLKAQQQLYAQFPGAPVEFVGRRSDIEALLSEASLYLHLARGEAWGVAVLEAMAAGVPAIVSEWTGAAEVVAQVWPEGVVPLAPAEAAERVLSYFSLPVAERHRLGEQSRTLIQQRYTHRHAIRHFQALFVEACRREGWAVELPLIAEG